MKAWTTYRDSKNRTWVITQLFFEGETLQEANTLCGCNMYQVGTDGKFQYVTKAEFEKLIEQKHLIKI